MITVYDHLTHPTWADSYLTVFESIGRTNGAYTYSQDICKYHLPIINNILAVQTKYANSLVSTVGTLSPEIIPANTNLIVEYVHETAKRDVPKCISNCQRIPGAKFIFITSRLETYTALTEKNISCVLIPMAIDTSLFTNIDKTNKYEGKKVIYFGNKYLGKNGFYNQTKEAFIKKGWKFDEISYNLFNKTEQLSRNQMLETIAKYKYGIGEGRCVLEMNALGLKTLICAGGCQGIMTNELDFNIQKQHNFSDGEVWTFSNDINVCVDNFDKAIIKTLDVHSVLLPLQEQLEGILLK